MRFLFPFLTATTPFSGYVHIIWSDPLYYTLFLWTAYALFSFFRNPRILFSVTSGVLLSLLFHTKPGSGIVIQFAAFLSLIMLLIISPHVKRKQLIIPI